MNCNSMHQDKFNFVLNLIQLLSISILFSLEAIHKCKCCQICVLRENLNAPEAQYSLTSLFFFFFQTAMEESGDIISVCGFAKMKKVVGRQWTEKCSLESLCKNRKYVIHLLADVVLIKPQPSSVPMCIFKGVVLL